MKSPTIIQLLAVVALAAFWLSIPAMDCPVDAEEIVVTFCLSAPELAEVTPVFITGSVPGLGNWNPGAVRMKQVDRQVWLHRLTLREQQPIEYKYTLGSWQREGADADGRPLQNFVVDVDQSTVKRDRVVFWTSERLQTPRGQITGRLEYHRQMEGDGLRPRDVIVWLPPDYDASEARYPVLYMHDGQNNVDPQTSAFGVDWEVDETCTALIEQGQIEPLIVVGIYNTPDRKREYLPGETSAAYMDFVVHTLKPFIDENYRTNPSRTHTYTAGSSAGGLCAFMLAWEHADVFSKALCMSPAFRVEDPEGNVVVDYVASVVKSDRPSAPVFFYVDNGGIGLEKLLQPRIDDMVAALRAKGLKAERDFHWAPFPDDRHFE